MDKETKICGKCKEEMNVCYYNKDKRRKDGLQNKCKFCEKKYREQNRAKINNSIKKWRDKNKQKLSDKNKDNTYLKEYRIKNKEKIKIKNQEYYSKHKDTIKKKVKSYYLKNKEKIHKNNNNYIKKRKNSDELFKISILMRNLVNRYLTKPKVKKTNEIIGLTPKEFREYIESKFLKNMTWDNYGEWHIDHIIPLSSAKNDNELYSLNHYTNLQPLWSTSRWVDGIYYIGNLNKNRF